jgi:hypothetical protein
MPPGSSQGKSQKSWKFNDFVKGMLMRYAPIVNWKTAFRHGEKRFIFQRISNAFMQKRPWTFVQGLFGFVKILFSWNYLPLLA